MIFFFRSVCLVVEIPPSLKIRNYGGYPRKIQVNIFTNICISFMNERDGTKRCFSSR